MPFVYNEDGAAPEQPVAQVQTTTQSITPVLFPSNSSALQQKFFVTADSNGGNGSNTSKTGSKRIQQLLTDSLYASSSKGKPSDPETVDGEELSVRSKNTINQIIPFLIKQHAKTLLSVQELQDRVASLEDLSTSLQSAMSEASSSTQSLAKNHNPWQAGTNLKLDEHTVANFNQVLQQTSKRSDCGTESDKQDSGLEVDSSHSRNSQTPSSSSSSQNHHQNNSHQLPNPHQQQADELLDLLDQICERGNHLRDYASTQQQLQQLNSDLAGMGDAQLLKENRELKRLLQKTEDEKKHLKDQIRSYESQLHRLQGERMAYEDKLSAVCFEKRQLESHVRALHVSCIAGNGNPVGGGSLPEAVGSLSHLQSGSNPLESSHLGSSFHESPSVNEKVSRVLKMDNPLELQRQLIEHIMDKEALQERLKKLEQTWGKRHQDWKKTEEALQTHVDDLMNERDDCIAALRKNQVDLRRLRSKLVYLESTLQKFDGNGLDLHGGLGDIPLPPWMQSASPRLVQSYHNNLAIGIGEERKSPHHSLPPRVAVNQAQNRHAFFRNEGPASLLSDQWIREDNPIGRRNFDDDDDLMSVHEELNSQIDQICSEFDPLSGKTASSGNTTHSRSEHRGSDENERDYDSLDLSIPLQPNKLHNTFT